MTNLLHRIPGPAALAICALLPVLGGACRPTAPVAPAGPSVAAPVPLPPETGAPLDPRALDPGVPVIREVRAEQQGTDLHVMLVVEPPREHGALPYDPYQPGGWSFQMFLDTDRQPTGYWLGYDYLTRDSESDLGGRAVRVRRTLAVQEPDVDGWGEATAVVPLRVSRSSLSFRIPLATISDQDGRIDYALEVYRTVDCPDCPAGRTHEYAYHVFGTTGVNGLALLKRGAPGGHANGHFTRLAALR